MAGDGYRILLQARARSEALRAKGFTWDQIADVLALDHEVSLLRLYRLVHGRTAADVVAALNGMDPAGTASLRETRLYGFEGWPQAGRRPPVRILLSLARLYQTRATSLVQDDVLGSYTAKDRALIEEADYCHLDAAVYRASTPSMRMEAGTGVSLVGETALQASACVEMLQAVTAEEADVKRRELLFELALVLGGVPAVTLLRRLSPESAEKLASAIRGPGSVDAAAVTAIETLTSQCRRLDDSWGPAKVVAVAVAQRQVVASLLQRDAISTTLRSRLVHVYAELCQLSGFLHYALMDYPAAEQRFGDGLSAALEIGDATLVAYIHYWLSEMACFVRQPAKALDHAFAADAWAKRSGSSLVRERAAIVNAWALAFDGQQVASLRALDAAFAWPDRLTSTEPPYLYWVVESRATDGNACDVFNEVGRPNDMIAAATRRLANCGTAYSRERAFGMLHYGRALVAQREIPEAAAKLGEAADIMRTHSSIRLIHQLGQIRRQLEPWAANTYVRNLDDKLHAYGLLPA